MKHAQRRTGRRKHGSLLAGLLFLVLGPALAAAPGPHEEHYAMWSLMYPDSSSALNVYVGCNAQGCQICHEQEDGDAFWNPYGWKIHNAMKNGCVSVEAILAAECFDSDGDSTGSLNIEEINNDTQPGWVPGPNNTIYDDLGRSKTNQLPPSCVQGSLDPTLALGLAVELPRGGGPGSPYAFLAGRTVGPVIGRTWDPVVTPFLPGAFADFVALSFEGPARLPTRMGTLLIAPPPSQVFYSLEPGTPFEIEIPFDHDLVGRAAWTQGGSVAPGPRIAFANGLDIVFGTH
jgi:hypothetical protein